MKAKKVLFITQEILPYVEESECSTLGKQLPVAAQEDGREVRIFMPKWGHVNERRNQLHEVIRLSGMNLIINDTDHPLIIKVASMQSSRMQVYFIDNDDYFMKRLMACDKNGKEYEDNGERAVFYARGVLETVKKLRWCPEVIICQGWMGMLVPFYIRTLYKDEPSFRDCKIVYMAHDFNLTKKVGEDFANSLYHKNLDPAELEQNKKETYYYEDLLEIATKYANGVILASPTIADKHIEIIKASGKPYMAYPEDPQTMKQCCNEFYDVIFSLDKNEE